MNPRNRTLTKLLHCAILAITALSLTSFLTARAEETINYIEPPKPYDTAPELKTPKGTVDLSKPILIPMITWAADGIILDLNGGTEPKPNSKLATAIGYPVELKLQNILGDQVKDYISGASPFIRGTSAQIALVAGALKKIDADLEPITIIQMSRSTGADMMVTKNLGNLTKLEGKTFITQLGGVHPEILANIFRDGNTDPTKVSIKYVANITDPTWEPGQPINDPANAFRHDPTADGATMIDVDGINVTGGGVGTGLDGTVENATIAFSTRTAPYIIFDCIAVRADFAREHPEIIEKLQKAHLQAQEEWLVALTDIKTQSREQKAKLLERAKPLAKEILDDANLASDFVVWLAEGSTIAGTAGNKEFFTPSNPNGFEATTARIQEYYKTLNLISGPTKLTANPPFSKGTAAPQAVAKATPVKAAFESEAAVRAAAESKNSNVMFQFTFLFNPQESEINWQDYPEIFAKINETVSRYGGAIVQIKGHGDNFFYRFVKAKREAGDKTYQKRDPATGEFSNPIPLPDLTALANDSMTLSYTRAFNVKRAFSTYVREKLGMTSQEVDLSRFDIKGMGITDPVVENPKTAEDRAQNMRCEVVIIAAESELPSSLSVDDLR